MRKTKVLIIIDSLSYGGVNQLVLNLLSEVDFEQYEIDIQYFEGEQNTAPELYSAYPCKLISIGRNHGAYLQYIKAQKLIIDKGGYDVVHSHICFKGLLVLFSENASMRRRTIIHSHYDSYPELSRYSGVVHALFRLANCTKIGCSPKAVEALFGNDPAAFWQKNGIDVERFAFDEVKRANARAELGIRPDCFTVTYVARFVYQKNHEFLIEVFEHMKKLRPESMLLLVGDGELEDGIKTLANKKGLGDSIQFLGKRSDVDCVLNASDLQLFPTRYEGLSMGLLEDQAAGLPCLCSDVVPPEVKCTDYLMLQSLNDEPAEWAHAAFNLADSIATRRAGRGQVQDAGFDKDACVGETLDIYQRIASTGTPVRHG